MENKKYRLQYLPLFEQDLIEIVHYITYVLKNPDAALRLADDVEAAILERVASDEMCTFLIMNISSLQLIPVNVIAYRSQYGSVNPAWIVGAGIVAMVYCKVKAKGRRA